MPASMPNEQRWLSLTGICNVLLTTPQHIRWLVNNNYLEMIPGNLGFKSARFLDPTPAYADKLKITELIYNRRCPWPGEMDLEGKALFTKAEIAALLGISPIAMNSYLIAHKVPCIKTDTNKRTALRFYTTKTVRSLIWQRQKTRTTSKQQSPFLLEELIQFFMTAQAEAEATTPTDLDFKQDDILYKKMAKLLKMPSPEKEVAVRDLWDKVEIAKKIADCLKTKTPTP